MPQMVALFNGVGGERRPDRGGRVPPARPGVGRPARAHGRDALLALIGSISFSGSLIAFGKLQELLPGRPVVFAGQQIVNGVLFAALLGVGVLAGATEGASGRSCSCRRALFGVLLVLPIGGATCPW